MNFMRGSRGWGLAGNTEIGELCGDGERIQKKNARIEVYMRCGVEI